MSSLAVTHSSRIGLQSWCQTHNLCINPTIKHVLAVMMGPVCSEFTVHCCGNVYKIHQSLKLTCRHINRRHICFNIKSISVQPLSCLISFVWSSPGCEQRSVSENFKMIMYVSAGNRTRDPLLSSVSL